MKNKEYYDLTTFIQVETETPQGKSWLILLPDGKSINIYEGHYVQLLYWLEEEYEEIKKG